MEDTKSKMPGDTEDDTSSLVMSIMGNQYRWDIFEFLYRLNNLRPSSDDHEADSKKYKFGKPNPVDKKNLRGVSSGVISDVLDINPSMSFRLLQTLETNKVLVHRYFLGNSSPPKALKIYFLNPDPRYAQVFDTLFETFTAKLQISKSKNLIAYIDKNAQ